MQAADIAIADISADYQSYRLMTPQPVVVDPGLAAMCAPVSQQQTNDARARHGPHAQTAISIYMDARAATAFGPSAGTFPPGSIVVKRKQPVASAGPIAVGGMVKRRAGFDPATTDWEFFYFTDPAHRATRDELQSCVTCHAAASNDHVYGGWSAAVAGK